MRSRQTPDQNPLNLSSLGNIDNVLSQTLHQRLIMLFDVTKFEHLLTHLFF